MSTACHSLLSQELSATETVTGWAYQGSSSQLTKVHIATCPRRTKTWRLELKSFPSLISAPWLVVNSRSYTRLCLLQKPKWHPHLGSGQPQTDYGTVCVAVRGTVTRWYEDKGTQAVAAHTKQWRMSSALQRRYYLQHGVTGNLGTKMSQVWSLHSLDCSGKINFPVLCPEI